MMRFLYPLIASALITITPFLITFEKGQDIVRGLFGFSEFALLLLFACARERTRGILRLVLLAAIGALVFAVAWIDLRNLLSIKNWNTGFYGLIPVVTCALALLMVSRVKSFSLSAISFIVFVSLMAHLAVLNFDGSQPIAQFPIVDYLSRTAPKPVERKVFAEWFTEKYAVTDSVTVTRDYVDTSRSNVVILVESWGIPLDSSRFAGMLKPFDRIVQKAGAHFRMYSRTRTAEREDLMRSFERDSSGKRDTTFLPQEFAKLGFRTVYFFGGDSLEQRRYKYIHNIGFNETFYGDGFDDHQMAKVLDSTLTAADSQKVFAAWTTRDTKFPLVGLGSAYEATAAENDSAYTVRLRKTLCIVGNLAKKHPNVRFIVQGDHEPILSPKSFQEQFYKRWVPFVVLNGEKK